MEAYTQLLPLVDLQVAALSVHPPRETDYYRFLHAAESGATIYGGTVISFCGDVKTPDMLSTVSDALIPLKGIRYALAAGFHEGRAYLSLRAGANEGDATRVLLHIVEPEGKGGGHNLSAGGFIEMNGAPEKWPDIIRDRILGHRRRPLLKRRTHSMSTTKSAANSLLADLTPAQIEAVTHMNGPMLVVAGAGSGKTRVVTRRIANLIGQGVKPWRILALTFTNKAAREMRERIAGLVGEAPAWMGTFHSVCARILRYDIAMLDDRRDGRFTIMDQGDQEGLVKQAMKRLDIDDKTYRPSSVLSAIGKAKSDFVKPEEYDTVTPRDRVIQEVYAAYEETLRNQNALDFDDLLILAARLLDHSPEALAKYRSRFPYILVDEYQDTNRAQYRLLRALAGSTANIHATGDPDQSIYSWRGADYRNIMDFQRDFPGARIVRLERNYRSGKFILSAANHLIRNNPHRIEKDLYTERPDGEQVTLARMQSDRMEALWIAERVNESRARGGRLGDMAVFYRTNAQSRSLEEALMREGLPYQEALKAITIHAARLQFIHPATGETMTFEAPLPAFFDGVLNRLRAEAADL